MPNAMDKAIAVLRASWRGVALLAEIARAALQELRFGPPFVPLTMNRGAGPFHVERRGKQARTLQLHQICQRLLPIFGGTLQVAGHVPTRGLLVANHLSYLDILVLASLTPCVFVAKSEVATWPVFGWFARRAGTIFVNRRRRTDVERVNREIRTALRSGALVVLFPEGTSSDGTSVLPFKSSLLEPAIGAGVPVNVGALTYELEDGDAREEVCYWRDHALVPHLFRLLSKRGVRASVSFSPVRNTWRDRKKFVAQLQAEVTALHTDLRAHRDAGLLPGAVAGSSPAGSETGAPFITPQFQP